MSVCPSCHLSFEPLEGGYAPSGAIVCARCAAAFTQQKQQAERRQLGSSFVGACGSILIGLASFFVELRIFVLPLPFLMPLLAVISGAATAHAAATNVEVRRALGKKRVPTIVLGTLGATLGLISFVVSCTASDTVVEPNAEKPNAVERTN